jgi:hypothetical protein
MSQAQVHTLNFIVRQYSSTPLIRTDWDGKHSGYAENLKKIIFSLKIGYIGSVKFGCYYLQYVPARKTPDHA